jgi:hypothetical protein
LESARHGDIGSASTNVDIGKRLHGATPHGTRTSGSSFGNGFHSLVTANRVCCMMTSPFVLEKNYLQPNSEAAGGRPLH